MKKTYFYTIHVFAMWISILFCSNIFGQEWIQLGADIDGEAANDISGFSICMASGTTLAIGSPWNSDEVIFSGQVRVFDLDGDTWIQRGESLYGEGMLDQFGNAVSMPDENTLAVGANKNGENGFEAGHVRIFDWDGDAWTQRGEDLDGDAENDQFGASVCMPDNNTIAVGAPWSDSNGEYSGTTKIFEWNGNTWLQKGSEISGEEAFNNSGESISMPNASTIAIGAPSNSDAGSDAGHVRIFEWDGSDWSQKGFDIDGSSSDDQSGWSVSMPDDLTVAIGALYNEGNGENSGQVRVYSWNGTSWAQKGDDIHGESSGDLAGFSISMSSENSIAIGSPLNDDNGENSGHVRIFDWNGTQWVQRGIDLIGEETGDQSGYAVSMPNPSTIGIGAYFNDGIGDLAGHVRVYSDELFNSILTQEKIMNFKVYPNPSASNYQRVELGDWYQTIDVSIENAIGELVYSKRYKDSDSFDLNVELKSGMYLLKIKLDGYAYYSQRILKM